MYDNPEHVRKQRHTVRYNRETDEFMRVVAGIFGEQPATFIGEMSVLAAKQRVRERILQGMSTMDEATRQYLKRHVG